MSNKVKRILFLNSSIVQMFFNVVMNFFTELSRFNYLQCRFRKQISIIYLTISTVPPADSIAPFAFSLTAFTLKGMFAFNTPFPKNFYSIILADKIIDI